MTRRQRIRVANAAVILLVFGFYLWAVIDEGFVQATILYAIGIAGGVVLVVALTFLNVWIDRGDR